MRNLDREALISCLEDDSPEVAAALYSEAYRVKKETVGENVYLRGLVEISERMYICAVWWRYPISAAKTACIAA